MTNLRKLSFLAAGLVLALPTLGATATAGSGSDRYTAALARIACRSVHRFRHCRLTGIERDTLMPGVQREQYHLQVGTGEFDTITIHRVTTRQGRSRRDALMLLPGTGLDVENIYLPGVNIDAAADDFSPLILAAQEGIDAWSADYRGSDLPAGLSDFSFMADWGLETAVVDMQLAIRFARLVRLFSGDGYQRIHVGGYSAGVSIAFSVASADTARHRGRRDIRGIVAIDDAFETDPADSAGDCEDLEFFDMQLASGVYNEDQTFIVEVATLAATDPDGPSVFGPPGFTNLQFANVLAVLPFSGTFHVFGGEFDEAGFPVPTFTDQDFLVQQAMLLERALPLRISRDLSAIRCSDTPVFDFDAGLADITVPVLHIGAAGGNGNAIDYTLGQIASTDITSSLVQLLPPGQEAFDYGHGDVFAATDADIRAWQPMVDWIKAR